MQFKRTLTIFAFVVQAFLALGVFAQSLTTAKYAGEFLSTGAGARALGMGGTSAAFANDVSAVYWNAAGLSALEYPEALFMHAQRFSGIVKFNFGAVALPYGKNATLGLGVIRLGVDDIPFTLLPRSDLALGEAYEEDGVTRINSPFAAEYFSDAEYGFFLSYGKRKSENFSYGGSVKIVHKAFHDVSAWGIGFDIGAQGKVGDKLLVGANFQDVTTTILAWNTGRKELIVPTLKIGAALPLKAEFLKGVLMPAVDADIRFEGRDFAAEFAAGPASLDYHAGLEYVLQEKIALRAGSDAGYFSAGAGLHLPKLQVDYAFMSHSDLGDTHRISVHLTISEPKYRRK